MTRFIKYFIIHSFLFSSLFSSQLEDDITKIEQEMIQWRRHLHQNPELSNREYETSKFISAKLKEFGLEVKQGIAHTGVVGILRSGNGNSVVALRADIDALPVTERVDIDFRSSKRAEFNGDSVGVMHACGHDAHISILLATAKVLSQNKDLINGTIKFIFQPAEEGAPAGEEGGALLMIKEDVLDNPKVDAIFGLHVFSDLHVGKIEYKPGGYMASADLLKIKVKGKQSHGARPWSSVDPIVVSSQIISTLQTIVSRNSQLTNEAAVVSIGSIHGGLRSNIIPEEVVLEGTIRALDIKMQYMIHRRIREICENIGKAMGAEVEVDIKELAPVTFNDHELVNWSLEYLRSSCDELVLAKPKTVAEDFAFYQKEIPGFYFGLGLCPLNINESSATEHHTPDFYIDESGMIFGVRAFCELAINYLKNN